MVVHDILIYSLFILDYRIYSPPPFWTNSSFLARYSKSPYKRVLKFQYERFMKIGQERGRKAKKGEVASLS
jgi:hypothetical protein